MRYKVHPKIIDSIVNIYKEDKTKIKVGDTEIEMEITSGIRQGCTGSTVLFKLITYLIMEKLEEHNFGFINEKLKIGILFFADDGLLMAHSTEEAKNGLKTIIEISNEYGLTIYILLPTVDA